MSEEKSTTADGLACLADPVVKLFDMAVRKGFAEEDKVREEIKQKGTYWAAGEIFKLRRRVEMFEKREREKSEKWPLVDGNVLRDDLRSSAPIGTTLGPESHRAASLRTSDVCTRAALPGELFPRLSVKSSPGGFTALLRARYRNLNNAINDPVGALPFQDKLSGVPPRSRQP